jgi:hypothetical protein
MFIIYHKLYNKLMIKKVKKYKAKYRIIQFN